MSAGANLPGYIDVTDIQVYTGKEISQAKAAAEILRIKIQDMTVFTCQSGADEFFGFVRSNLFGQSCCEIAFCPVGQKAPRICSLLKRSGSNQGRLT